MVTVSTVIYAVSLITIAARVSIMVATGVLETRDALIRPIIDSKRISHTVRRPMTIPKTLALTKTTFSGMSDQT
jgi:hypothetical protein